MNQAYVGSELELFAEATHWKSYFSSIVRPYVAGHVLEVGAGIGANVPYLYNDRVSSWTCLEPDPLLARRIEQHPAGKGPPQSCRIVLGTIDSIAETSHFDTILYLDVLEHIAEDAAELARARRHLAPKGHLIVLAPAHQFLFSPFDSAIGHYRRYGRRSLLRLAPSQCRLLVCAMLDCAGFFASLANRLLLSKALPSPRQIAVWDRLLVPLSRRLDALFGYRFGKTVVAVWRAAA
jgi:SAM-dependent methyltransferase